MIKGQLRSLLTQAADLGVPASALAELTGDAIRQQLDQSVRAGYATPEEGLAFLLNEEGGCADVAEATGLFRKPKRVSPQAITRQIRHGNLIAISTGGGRYRIPRWQFRPEGGVWPGLVETLAVLQISVPGFSPLSPFAFFLQAHPLTGGRTPLEAIRQGDQAAVLFARPNPKRNDPGGSASETGRTAALRSRDRDSHLR